MDLPKHKEKRPWPVFILALASLIGIISMLLFFPPGSSFLIFSISFYYSWLFLPILFICLYGFGAFFLKSAIQGMLIASLITLYLLFRLMHLTNPLFAILLLILFLSLEAVFWKRD